MMDTMRSQPGNRREFLKDCGRYAVLGALALGSLAAFRRSRRIERSGQTCINRSVCCECSAFPRCALPAALSAKQAGVGPAEG